ncbi:VQ motif-containing protein 4 [Phoenix dactylifera]|uniref:VQ motif-containing protein 4 n=1 Tax=Phoenix dactylifera TaxID=42345 RepID=A0A8B7C907_PHODC|nr:VQ motif-containing protein 4 [Phoenix dactylifera]
MENHPKTQDKASAPLQASSLNTTSNSNSNYSNGATTSSPPSAPPPLTPKSIPKAPEVNPYPTTFVQADTSSFKQVVQMLTGSTETAAAAAATASSSAAASKGPIAPAAKPPGPKKPAFKLYERRNSLKNLKITSPLIPAYFASYSNPDSPVGATAFSPRMQPEILSPSMLDFPSLALSPVTPLIPDPFNRPPHPCSEAAKLAEDRAIAEKGFYLHPSPRTTPRDAEPPRLLPLFPETSPSVSSSPSPVTTSSPSP